jgi:superfamily I DNA/RNA helicase
MGFASYLEDINNRYFESESWTERGGGRDPPPPPPDPVAPPPDPLERLLRLIARMFDYYQCQQPLGGLQYGWWEGHLNNVKTLHTVLAPCTQVDEKNPAAWDLIKDIEERLRTFFQKEKNYGPLSRSVFNDICDKSRTIQVRCTNIAHELDQFKKISKASEETKIREAEQKLSEIKERFDQDLKELKLYDPMIKEARGFWDRFLSLRDGLAVKRNYRPVLQQLDRFQLNKEQEKFVALDHEGAYRIQGASGSGKTIILVHRALRLAWENPKCQVRVFTINRALAELLRATVVAVGGQLPLNLDVSAFYDFLLDSVSLFEPREKYRLVDDRSGERIVRSWRAFYHHFGQSPQQNVFALREVRSLIRFIEERMSPSRIFSDDDVRRLMHSRSDRDRDKFASSRRYLREEMIYIQSAYRRKDRQQYLTDYRRSRAIAFQTFHKMVCLHILEAWEEYREVGHLCDIDGLTVRAAEYFDDSDHLDRIRKAKPTHFVLVDEVQDFSTLELGLLRELVPDPKGRNAIFLAGDPNQKVYPKHHDSRRAGFDFRGKAGTLKQNFRNTRQILKAAYHLPQTFPPKGDEEDSIEVMDPDLSIYEGGLPLVFECSADSHRRRVLELIKHIDPHNKRVAVISENEAFLEQVREKVGQLEVPCHRLIGNEDLDRWRNQGDWLAAGLYISRLEAVKGFEFDIVISCHLTEGIFPAAETPEEEHWRQAAVLYTALTRARDQLIITYVGEQSRFLKAMLDDVELCDDTIGEEQVRKILIGM